MLMRTGKDNLYQNFSPRLGKALGALLNLLGQPCSIDTETPRTSNTKTLSLLYNFADRKGCELCDPSWKNDQLFHKLSPARAFLDLAFPRIEISIPKQGSRAILCVPGAHAKRMHERFSIAKDARNILTSHSIAVPSIVNVLGYRAMSPAEVGSFVSQHQQSYDGTFNEKDFWPAQYRFIQQELQLPGDLIHTLRSGIFTNLYKHSDTPSRSTTFDNAAAVAKWVQQALKKGFLSENDSIIFCIEQPFSHRMFLIFKTMLQRYINNPIHIYAGATPYTQPIDQNTTPLVDLSAPINQLYLELKFHHAIQTQTLWPETQPLNTLKDIYPG